jgi:membrane protease YdiL (CAAX protease family)
MSSRASFWLLIIIFFILWTLRVIYLPSPDSDTLIGFLNNTILRLLFFFMPFLLAAVFLGKADIRDIFSLRSGTRVGWIFASFYSLALILYEVVSRTVVMNTNPWLLINFPFAPVIEELVFRGFIFTHLLKWTGKVQTILISSVLFTLIHFPGWIFISELKGENFIVLTGQVFIFSLFQGVIRLYSKSILPNIIVHLINNFFSFATE